MAHTPDHAKECLEWLNRQMEDAMAAREKRMETAREYWNGKPRTMLNDRLWRIEVEKHEAQFIQSFRAIFVCAASLKHRSRWMNYRTERLIGFAVYNLLNELNG